MEIKFGKLILMNLNGPVQEYNLAKPVITLGRAHTNDIILDDGRISRSHARLDFDPHGVTIVDLGSSNGTRLNGVPIQRATLQPGDTLSLGGQQLKYLVESPAEDVGSTSVIDSHAQLDHTINLEFLPVVINETRHPCLVVFTGHKTWRVDLDDQERVMIGRDVSCGIYIYSSNISRRHAEVQRAGDSFILKDCGSTNGAWLNNQRIDQATLRDGDVFRVGEAQIIFKGGFQEQAMTMAHEILSKPGGRQPVVFLPGLMGSELWLGSERVWPNVKILFTNPEIFTYPSTAPLEPRNIVDEVVIVPNLIKQDQYNRLGDYLVEELLYTRGADFFEFAYDWRQDVRLSARQLSQMIDNLPCNQPVTIIAHSLGTMVTRYYIEHLGGYKRVKRAILMGGPHKGAVKGLVSMLVAPDVLPFGLLGERLREIVLSFPSSYQILPDYPVGKDQYDQPINFLRQTEWLSEKHQPLIRFGQEFRNELANCASVPTVTIFGYGMKTISDVTVTRDTLGKLQNVDYLAGNTGDGSVLEQSAFLDGADIHPVHQNHGSLFVDNDVKMRLKLELTR
jgi:pSer/pThr/pTyr-binding forkhead associated (FHA) protein